MAATIETYFVPTTLYRYRSLGAKSLARELKALKEGHIFCPRFDELNDPMESEHRVSKLLKRSQRYPTIAARLETKVNSIGIASFSESRVLEPMWAYYADNFRGMCVAYSMSRLKNALPDECQLARIGYNETPPLLSVLTRDLDERARAVLCAKTVRWSHEREWRLFAPSRGAVTYSNKECVTAVYLGKRMEPSTRDQLLMVLDACAIEAHLMDIKSYRLKFTKRTARP